MTGHFPASGRGVAVSGGESSDDSPTGHPGPTPSFRVELNVQVNQPDPPISGWLEACVARIAALAGVDRGLLGIAIVGDAPMAALHQRYKGHTGTTDVLTFDLREHPQDDIEADVVICLDEAARQASRRGHAVRHEVLLYAVHGLLHLLGYDDHNPVAAAAMHQREDELLTAAGLGPVFHVDEVSPQAALGR